MPYFTKKPVQIEARQYDGTLESAAELVAWIVRLGCEASCLDGLLIETLEGTHRANPGDWIIKGVAGEFYPCKPGIFAATYTAVKDTGGGSMTLPRNFMVFDVESIGLHGEGFAVAWVVVNRDGDRLGEGCMACPRDLCSGTDEGRLWVDENVPPLDVTSPTPHHLRDAFWHEWRRWADQGAVLVADCAWPVEANFLSACVRLNHTEREWQGPYPVYDLASVLLALGADALATAERLPDELPAHHPLMDARQSARQLAGCLKAHEERRGSRPCTGGSPWLISMPEPTPPSTTPGLEMLTSEFQALCAYARNYIEERGDKADVDELEQIVAALSQRFWNSQKAQPGG